MLVKVLVEVAEVRACKASCQKPAAPFEFCQEAELLVEVAEVRTCKASCHIYTPTAFLILPGEADRDAGAGAEGIGNVTSTGNSELLEVLAYQLEMETRPTPVD